MNDPIRIPVVLTRGGITGQAQAHGDLFYTDITDDHICAIAERANALGLLGGKLQLPAPRDPMPEIKFDAPPFYKPTEDTEPD